MATNRSIPDADIIPELAYADVSRAAAWLCSRFGFSERLRIADHRVQLSFGRGAIVVTQRPVSTPGGPSATHATLVRVPDATRHHARAAEQGVKIVRAPQDYPYGERQYTAEDLGGHLWTFSQTLADIDPATWGGKLTVR